MRRLSKYALMLLLVGAAAWIAWRSVVFVDETQFVVVTELGRPVAVFGDGPAESGFHAIAPWRSTLAIDRRMQVTTPPSREMITGDKRNLEVSSYVVWRVGDPMMFLRGAGTLDGAEARLEERVSAVLSAAIGGRKLDNLASTDPKTWQLESLADEVVATVSRPALAELGVEVIDVRLKQFVPPVEVRPAVFDLIRSERKQVAAALRAEGEAEYQGLVSDADRERDAILAAADADAERIRGRGEAEAIAALNAAHAQDPKFFELLQTLQTYRAVLDEKATVVLSAASPLMRLFTQGPSEETLKDDRPSGPLAGSPPADKPSAVTGSPGSQP